MGILGAQGGRGRHVDPGRDAGRAASSAARCSGRQRWPPRAGQRPGFTGHPGSGTDPGPTAPSGCVLGVLAESSGWGPIVCKVRDGPMPTPSPLRNWGVFRFPFRGFWARLAQTRVSETPAPGGVPPHQGAGSPAA